MACADIGTFGYSAWEKSLRKLLDEERTTTFLRREGLVLFGNSHAVIQQGSPSEGSLCAAPCESPSNNVAIFPRVRASGSKSCTEIDDDPIDSSYIVVDYIDHIAFRP